jgi:hypothetical protein
VDAEAFRQGLDGLVAHVAKSLLDRDDHVHQAVSIRGEAPDNVLDRGRARCPRNP